MGMQQRHGDKILRIDGFVISQGMMYRGNDAPSFFLRKSEVLVFLNIDRFKHDPHINQSLIEPFFDQISVAAVEVIGHFGMLLGKGFNDFRQSDAVETGN